MNIATPPIPMAWLSLYLVRHNAMKICVLQHLTEEGPGHIKTWADGNGHTLDIYHSNQKQLPQRGNIDALVILGGPASATGADAPVWISAEKNLIRSVLDDPHIPILGICLGAQLIADQLGARVAPMAQSETGWQTIYFEESDTSPIPFLQWHDDGFDLPVNATLLASSAAWPVQGYSWDNGRVMGFQFHPEWDLSTVKNLQKRFGTLCPLPTPSELDSARFLAAHTWLGMRLNEWLQR